MAGIQIRHAVARDTRFSRSLTAVLPLLLVLLPHCLSAQAPGRPTIHQYADAAACQMGAREPNYLPFGILPGGNRIPITWQQKEVFWVPNTAPPNGTGEFKIDDGTGNLVSIGMDSPEAGAGGPFTDPVQSSPGNPTGRNLKCDHFSYVNPSCTPDQFVREVFQGSCAGGASKGAICSDDDQCPNSTCGGMVRWHILFRRSAAAATAIDNNPATPQPADWGRTYIPFYDVVDAIGLKLDSYGTVWLDGLGVPDPNTGTVKSAARDFTNGFRAGPMPRPGGKRPDQRKEGQRASLWFDTPDTMVGGACNGCHGTPLNGSDWIKLSGLTFKDDEDLPWWHAGNETIGFPDNTFFTAAQMGGVNFRCRGCHERWMMNATSTPGGEGGGTFAFARFMTMVHDAHMAVAGLNDLKGQPDIDNPFKNLPPAPDNRYRDLASSFRTDKPQQAFLDKNAQQTHYMPPKHTDTTIRDWLADQRDSYNWVGCCGAGLAGLMMQPPNTNDGPAFNCFAVTCTGQVSQDKVKAVFITPWMQANGKAPAVPATSNGMQFVDAPDPAAGASLTLVACPAGIGNPGDQCFHLAWSDPNGSPFNAPQTFHYKQLPNKKVSDPDWTAADIQSTQYCGDEVPTQLTVDPASSQFPNVKETQIAVASGDKWRFSYETFDVLPKCQKMAIRLCGGWCPQTIQVNGEPAPKSRLSTGLGQLLTLANDTLGDFSNQISVYRGGFRKNLTTGRWVQTVTLTNAGQVAIPAPVSLVLKNLSANATLYNQSGTVGAPASPYISVAANGDSLQLKPGESVAVVLEFTNPTNKAITYMTQALALSVSAACQ